MDRLPRRQSRDRVRNLSAGEKGAGLPGCRDPRRREVVPAPGPGGDGLPDRVHEPGAYHRRPALGRGITEVDPFAGGKERRDEVVALLPQDIRFRSGSEPPGLEVGGEREPGGQARHRALDEAGKEDVGEREMGEFPDADHLDGIPVPLPGWPCPGGEKAELGGELHERDPLFGQQSGEPLEGVEQTGKCPEVTGFPLQHPGFSLLRHRRPVPAGKERAVRGEVPGKCLFSFKACQVGEETAYLLSNRLDPGDLLCESLPGGIGEIRRRPLLFEACGQSGEPTVPGPRTGGDPGFPGEEVDLRAHQGGPDVRTVQESDEIVTPVAEGRNGQHIQHRPGKRGSEQCLPAGD